MYIRNLVLYCSLFVAAANAFLSASTPSSVSISAASVSPVSSFTSLAAQSRADFLRDVVTSAAVVTTTMAAGFSSSSPAWAASSSDPSLKGTKKDPAYEACVSKCMYECTKPKVDGQKTRQECLPDCKKQCATTKEQLMKGTPKTAPSL